ncbi:ABC transporter ATP-binding protein [Oribacterium sp. WCC10]|uniref:ABC transporter ATP-binding protein n=1 Tax=Oribacterium sp. WCC10 TaxID=1855343 RepID=UPI0008EC221E|nr:ABC transporter ATP-binding protein [Oribacterium sp. WCC10]SFG48178.1 ABC-2 type transport system ATP-binding protein [Oribacterium sp. WCC10]
MLDIRNLSKNFKNKEVLKDLCLTVEDKSIVGLVGVNGAGKSTLLRSIAGVYAPEKGSITLDGKSTYYDMDTKRKIAFVSDEAYFPMGSTIDSLKLFYECMYDFDRSAFSRYLRTFELDPKASISTFSKGMKRRVSLMFALSIHPKLLLLDEAYDGLEPLARLHFKNALTDLLEDEDVSVVISSHSLKELEDICDSFAMLENGRIVSGGDLTESKSNINKFQLAFREELSQNDFAGLDILRFEKEGQVYKLVIRGDAVQTEEKLRAMNPILLNVLPVNFEELFIYELESRGNRS